MIIYGYRKFKRLKGLSMRLIHCEHCGSDTNWQFIHLWTWMTIFFIPIFPVFRQKMLICPKCEYGIKITKDNQYQIMSMVRLN